MTFVPVMWSVWGFTIVLMFGMFLYRSRITRDEEDQLFLDDSQHKAEQAVISARAGRVQPLIKGSELIAAVTTLFVIGYYVIDVINQFK
jgi:hypothetical protein